jgi:uncharacterized protein YtpQ (UPF0354 family)
MEREPQGGSDYGRDLQRDLGDERKSAIRDTAPDYLAPIDAASPVSGHVPAPANQGSAAETPEHDWGAAAKIIFPILRPVGTTGMASADFDPETLSAAPHGHTQPILDEGPCGIAVAYALSAGAFDVIANPEHVMSWGVRPTDVQEAAFRNLAGWAATAPWTDEVSGDRRLISSDTGDGWDASRILLPETRQHLTRELGATGRVLVGLPERHLLIAGTLRPGDEEFAALFADFVLEHSGGADEPVDRRVFELVDGELVELGAHPGADHG